MKSLLQRIYSYGVFLRLPTAKFRKSALVPMRHLTDTFVEDPRELFSVHQTLVGKVLERHEEDQKVTMSAKLKDVQTGGTEMSVELTKSIFRDPIQYKKNWLQFLPKNHLCFGIGIQFIKKMFKIVF